MGVVYLGRKIYFEKSTGNVVLEVGERYGWVLETDFDKDFEIYTELSKYEKEAIDVIKLEFGEYRTEFSECTSYKVNPETKEIMFDYTPLPDPELPPASPTLRERVEELEKQNADLILTNAMSTMETKEIKKQNADLLLEVAMLKAQIQG